MKLGPKMFKKNRYNFCDQYSISFILKSFYKILLTWSKTYFHSETTLPGYSNTQQNQLHTLFIGHEQEVCLQRIILWIRTSVAACCFYRTVTGPPSKILVRKDCGCTTATLPIFFRKILTTDFYTAWQQVISTSGQLIQCSAAVKR